MTNINAVPDSYSEVFAALSPERSHVALEAACEVEAIACVLQRHFTGKGAADAEALHLRGLSIRLEVLATVCIAALGDAGAELDDIRDDLLGPEAARARRSQGGAVG